MEEEIRKAAIMDYVKGEPPKEIYTRLNRSKKWFFKWLKRYQTGNAEWYKENSRAPKSQARETSRGQKELILTTRKRLEEERFAQVGSSAIKWELQKMGASFPSDRTINRILNKEGLTKKTSYAPKGVEYPYFTEPAGINNIHQADLVGPRYIKGDGRFYSFNVIDIFSHRVYVESGRTKEDDQVAASLMKCWKTMGIPEFLQMDNELSFRGSNRYPRSLGIVLRICLHYGVTPVFIPIGEPWRNGVVEHFNDTYNRKSFRRQWFPSYATLKKQAKNFQCFHNRHHRYSLSQRKDSRAGDRGAQLHASGVGAKHQGPLFHPNSRWPHHVYTLHPQRQKAGRLRGEIRGGQGTCLFLRQGRHRHGPLRS